MIRVRSLKVEIDHRLILAEVHLDVDRGEAVGLVGPNGSGKSTLLRALVGLVPFSGDVSIAGRDVATDGVGARTWVAYLPQRAAFGEARVGEVLTFVARLRGIDGSRVRRVLEQTGLSAQERDRARTLSGGQQQRLALAVALLTDAPVMLLDEPSASLDLEGQRAFWEVAAALREDGRTLLIASHRPEEIARLTDRVVRLDAGRLVGSTTRPAHEGVLVPQLIGDAT